MSQAHSCCAIPQTRAWRPARGRRSHLASRQRQDAHRPSSASRTGEQSYTHLKATEPGSGTARAPHGSRSEPGALSTPAFPLQLPNSCFQTPKSPPLKTHLHLASPALRTRLGHLSPYNSASSGRLLLVAQYPSGTSSENASWSNMKALQGCAVEDDSGTKVTLHSVPQTQPTAACEPGQLRRELKTRFPPQESYSNQNADIAMLMSTCAHWFIHSLMNSASKLFNLLAMCCHWTQKDQQTGASVFPVICSFGEKTDTNVFIHSTNIY